MRWQVEAPAAALLGLVALALPLAAGGALRAASASDIRRGHIVGAGGSASTRSAQASERPAWGRDYGAEQGFGRSAPKEDEGGSPCSQRGTKHSGSVHEVLRGSIVDNVHYLGEQHAWASQLIDDSCEKVCMRCMFESLKIQGRGACNCAANCLQGPDNCACEEGVQAGWTAAHVTAPTRSWQAVCGGGDRDCLKDCLSEKFSLAIGRCDPKTSMDPTTCIAVLQGLYKPFLENRNGKVFCSHEHMESCDTFGVPPVNASRQWSCFNTWEECRNTKIPAGYASSRESKSVWKSIRLPA